MKKHTFADERTQIQIQLDKRGDLSFANKKKLVDRIEKYCNSRKSLMSKYKDKKDDGPMYDEFKYELMKLKEEVTPFNEFKNKVKTDLESMGSDSSEEAGESEYE